MPTSSKWSLSLRFSHQNPAWTSPLFHAFNMPHPSHCLWFVTGIIFDEGYRCYLRARVGRLSTLCLDPYVDPDFGDTKVVRSVGTPAYQLKHKALHFRREARASSVCISFYLMEVCARALHRHWHKPKWSENYVTAFRRHLFLLRSALFDLFDLVTLRRNVHFNHKYSYLVIQCAPNISFFLFCFYLSARSASILDAPDTFPNQIHNTAIKWQGCNRRDFCPLINVTSFIKDNNNKYPNNKMYTFTYNPLRFQHVSIFFRSSSGVLYPTSLYKTQINYKID